MADDRRLVWDLPLRLFHWLFALSIAALWATAEYEMMDWHFKLGYWMIGLLAFRIIWGFVGPRHARFINFIHSPPAVFRYAKAIFKGEPVYTVGHNPLGSLMVIVMLVLVSIQAVTGLFASDDILWYGPYNPAVDSATARSLTRLHHQNFNWILIAIVLHIAAILFYGLVKKQNLVLPMLTGKKPAAYVPEHEAIASSELLKAAIVIAISCGAVYWLLSSAPPPIDDFAF